MAIVSPDIGGLSGGMQAIAEGGGVSSALKSVDIAGPKLGGEIQTAFGGPGALNPEISADFTSGLDKTLDTNPNAGIKDIAGLDLKDADVKLVGAETPTETGKPTGESTTTAAAPTEVPAANGPTSPESTTPAATEQPDEVPTAAVPENADKIEQTQALEAKVKDGTATAEDLKALRELKADPAQHRADLEQKALDGTISDDEITELGNLNASETTSSQTPEQQAEELMKREGLGTSTEEGLAGLSTEQRQQIQEAFEEMFKDVDKARRRDAEKEREMKRLQKEMQRLREQNKRLTDRVKELNERLDTAASEQAPEYKKAA
jgi:hypothetical protein